MLIIKSPEDEEFQDLRRYLAQAKKVIVVTGAGISTNCKIPDFRSTYGLNKRSVRQALQELDNAVLPRQNEDGDIVFHPLEGLLFDGLSEATLSKPCTELFYTAALMTGPELAIAHYRFFALFREAIRQNVVRPSYFHTLVQEMKRKGVLAHWLTQNIDGLEALAGCKIYTNDEAKYVTTKGKLDPTQFDVVQLHGSLCTAWCTKTSHQISLDTVISNDFLYSRPTACPKCLSTPRSGTARIAAGPGQLRPGVVLYGDNHTNVLAIAEVITEVVAWDIKHGADVLLIAGTSLRVQGAINLVQDIVQAMEARRPGGEKACVIIVGHTMPAGSVSTSVRFFVQMDCDNFAKAMMSIVTARSSSEQTEVEVDLLENTEVDVMGAMLS